MPLRTSHSLFDVESENRAMPAPTSAEAASAMVEAGGTHLEERDSMWRVCAMGTFARKLRDRERGARDGADATLSTSATRSRAAREARVRIEVDHTLWS